VGEGWGEVGVREAVGATVMAAAVGVSVLISQPSNRRTVPSTPAKSSDAMTQATSAAFH
jgi:hypothetical protein